MIAYNEQELLYLYHLGSSIAYKLLLDEYKNKIEIFVKRYCRETALTSAEDYSQEALLVLIGIFDRYRYDKNASINTYFSNAINDVLKLQKRILNRGNKISTISLDQEIYGSNMRIENIIADQKSYNRPEYQLRLNENKSYYLNKIEKASSSLERKIFDCFMKGYKSKEIAELLNIDIRCVYNAKYRLQKKMDKSK